METGNEFLNFHLIRNWSPNFAKFEVLSLDCNHAAFKNRKIMHFMEDAISELEPFVWNLGDL